MFLPLSAHERSRRRKMAARIVPRGAKREKHGVSHFSREQFVGKIEGLWGVLWQHRGGFFFCGMFICSHLSMPRPLAAQ